MTIRKGRGDKKSWFQQNNPKTIQPPALCFSSQKIYARLSLMLRLRAGDSMKYYRIPVE